MKKIQQSIIINASREAVWAAIINDHKYRLWAEAFVPDTYFAGSWQQGQSIKFLMKDDQDQLLGMMAEIAESEHLRRISIQQLGMINGEKVDFFSDEAPVYENYELEQISPQLTRFSVDVDVHEDYLDDLTDGWIEALSKLKEVCEKNLAPFASITLTTDVKAPVDHVWNFWTSTDKIKKWNHASDDWHCPEASNDLRVGGRFVYTMAALDGSVSFNFAGTYTEILHAERITSQLDDGRMVRVTFKIIDADNTQVTEIFEAEHENSYDLQRDGWQAILKNFKKEAEAEQSTGSR